MLEKINVMVEKMHEMLYYSMRRECGKSLKKVLIQDIAEEMGLSRNTVAKALKNDGIVTESTRKKIIRKAYEMGYQKLTPEALRELQKELQGDSAKTLRATKKYVILMSPYETDDFWSGVVLGITERIKREDGSCLLLFVTLEDEKNGILPSAMVTDEIEGIMCLKVFLPDYRDKITGLGIPVVFMDSPVLRRPYRCTHDVILLEGAQSVYEITAELIRRGCRRIGFIGDISYCHSIYDRWLGYCEALKDGGLQIEEDCCLNESREDHYYSREAIEEGLNAMKELPDALVCANDYIALVVIQYCKVKQIPIPQRIAVSGFDNKKECMIIEPPLTSVNTTNRRIGFRVAEQLLWRIGNPAMHTEIITIATEPYFRESTAR